MLTKKLICLGLTVFLFCSVSVPVLSAAETQITRPESIITPQFININLASSFLSISSSGVATIKGYVQKTPSGDSINVSCSLQSYSNGWWYSIKSWSESSTSFSAYITETYTVSKGTYRVATYFSVSGASGTETGTVYSTTVTY